MWGEVDVKLNTIIYWWR